MGILPEPAIAIVTRRSLPANITLAKNIDGNIRL
jgi:hypothetical protein